MTTAKSRLLIEEDWTSVILGFGIIALALGGVLLTVPTIRWTTGHDLATIIFSAANLKAILLQFIFVFILATVGIYLTGRSVKQFLAGFPVIFLLTIVAMIASGNTRLEGLNLEAVIFSLAIGLLVGNLFKLPDWLRNSLSTELFVKIGLVLLGVRVIFADILKAGSLGLLQAVVVILSVWYFAFWICRKLKVDPELTMMISSAVSICGVSAAIATSGAIKGDSKKLSSVISMVLIIAIPMMIFLPMIGNYFGFPEAVIGAWLGGTIDTTGAVVAAGTLVGDTALQISTIVKFSQNVLLGIAAFAISIYWTYTKNDKAADPNTKPTLGTIWARFPKFVLGFVLASLLFSFILSAETKDQVSGSLRGLQGLWFVLAFTSIGLETKFSELFNKENKKPLYGFVIAQGFNIIITLIVAFILFGR